jgi:hypothetical protein
MAGIQEAIPIRANDGAVLGQQTYYTSYDVEYPLAWNVRTSFQPSSQATTGNNWQ